MRGPRTIEDGFEYRAKEILRGLLNGVEGDVSIKTAWLLENRKEVGTAFLEDVESYMGIEDAIGEIAKDDDEELDEDDESFDDDD